MSLRKALLAATILSLPLTAQAQPVTGLYVGAGVGANYREDSNSGYSGPGSQVSLGSRRPTFGTSLNQEFNWGFAGALSLGWGFGNGLRAEVEGNFRQNDVDKVTTRNGALIPHSGYGRSYGVMANVLYDFNIPNWPVVPYIGAGVGYVWTENKNVGGFLPGYPGPTSNPTANGVRFRSDDTDSQFAYQAIGGLALPIPAVPGLAITAEYRYLASLNARIDGNVRTVSGAAIPGNSGQGRLSVENMNHSIMLGVRYNFGVAPPPPPPPPVAVAPAPARTYLVF
ncbi:outer membrane beta-barrel protein, partial [Roseomonas sp. NAR14]